VAVDAACTFALLAALGAGFGIGWVVGRALDDDAACITSADIERAQEAWSTAVINIGTAWNAEQCVGALREANAALDAAYSFERPLLFKPTLAVPPHTFRPTRSGALSYFIGNCSTYDESFDDYGFALTGDDYGFALGYSVGHANNQTTWLGFTSVDFSQMSYHLGGVYCGAAVAQGRMTYRSRFTYEEHAVDKTFVYVRNPNGGIPLITAHHSSPNNVTYRE
jgi:hypothetical protein